ncbi:hypothetical protein BVRB_7g178370 [Beta vulgaris subsp. vulgaris]|nr:hypothetical protein BVRB_7g178370 [Beta vulgaris subsp. vulgaris]
MANPNQAARTVEIMEKELYVAAMRGDVMFLQADIAQSNEYLRRKTHENNNIIHIAIRHQRENFVEASLRRLFPINSELISERNSKGNTPLHVAAEVGKLNIVTMLFNYLEGAADKPWRVQNSSGNTPLHVALIHQNAQIAQFLLNKDPDLASIVNASKEAPLHLAIKHLVNYAESTSIIAGVEKSIKQPGAKLSRKFVIGEDMLHIITFLANSYVACWPDANGSTPLHQAALLSTPYNVEVIRTILRHWPLSAEVCDASGNSILHLMTMRMSSYDEAKTLLEIPEIYALKDSQDQQGNTPLHIAAENKNIMMVRFLLEFSAKISIKNMKGISAASLIRQHNLAEHEEED